MLLDEQVREKGRDNSDHTAGSSHEDGKSTDTTTERGPTREDVVMATIQELERIKTRSSDEMEDLSE